jgi:predicted Rossmann-fold nucleotide-binding protein
MDERKNILFDKSNSVIMLPGGMGTLDEFFEIMNLVKLERRNHKL